MATAIGDHASEWAAIQSIATKIGCSADFVRRTFTADRPNQIWVADLARITYYIDTPGVAELFFDLYRDEHLSRADYATGIRLEHTRQLLRELVKIAMQAAPLADLQRAARAVEDRIARRLKSAL